MLGAAQSCLGIIRTIKKMGHKAIVTGDRIDLPGIAQADKYLIVEDNDIENVIAFAQEIGIDGIVPTPVDRPLIKMATVAERLGLPFLSVEAAKNFRHKFLMKECLQKANIKCARGFLTSPLDFSPDQLHSYDFPVIIKPIDGYASRGVVKIDSLDELKSFIPEAASFSSTSQFVVEEFIDGREFNAEGVCYHGNVEVYAIVEKVRDPFPRTIEMGHIVPPDISAQEEKIIVDTISRAVVAVGMQDGAFNAEIKLNDGVGVVIEVNGRLAGDFIVSHLLQPTIGQDMEEAVVNIALGIPPEKARRNYIKHGMISFFNLPEGKKIKKINDFSYLHNDPEVIWAYLFFSEGDVIPEVIHMGHRSGFVIVTSPSYQSLMEKVQVVKDIVINAVLFE